MRALTVTWNPWQIYVSTLSLTHKWPGMDLPLGTVHWSRTTLQTPLAHADWDTTAHILPQYLQYASLLAPRPPLNISAGRSSTLGFSVRSQAWSGGGSRCSVDRELTRGSPRCHVTQMVPYLSRMSLIPSDKQHFRFPIQLWFEFPIRISAKTIDLDLLRPIATVRLVTLIIVREARHQTHSNQVGRITYPR